MNQLSKAAVSLLILATVLLPSSEAQLTSTFFPSSEYTFGSYLPTMAPCFSNNINRNSFSLFPTMHTFMFTAATNVLYIRVWSDNLVPFYASIVAGGVNTKGVEAVQVSSLHGGKLAVNIQVFCA